MSSYFDNSYGEKNESDKDYESEDNSSEEEDNDLEEDTAVEEETAVEDDVEGTEVEEDDEDVEEDDNVDEDLEEDEDEDLEEDEDEDLEEDEDEDEDEEKNMIGGGSGLEEGDLDSAEEAIKSSKKKKKIPAKNIYKPATNFIDDDEEDNDDGEQYLQKFDQSVNENYILNFHPESVLQNYDEILSMTKIIRDTNGLIIDKLHRTIPFLTKYEKSRILGQRAKQINSGAYPFVKVPENVIDGYIIAELELKQQRIPFIIRRPLPNRGSEYWKVKDLEDIAF